MANLVKALFIVVVETLAAAGISVSQDTAKALRSLCGITQKTGTNTEKFKVFLEMFPQKKQSLEESGVHASDNWIAAGIIKAVKQNEAENHFGGVTGLLKNYVGQETLSFLKGEPKSIDFTLDPKEMFINAINSWIKDSYLVVNEKDLRSRLAVLFNLEENQIIIHVTGSLAESFRISSVSKQEEKKDNTVNNIADNIIKLPLWRQRAITARVNRALGTNIDVKNLATHAIEDSKTGEAIRHEFDALATTNVNYGSGEPKYELTEEVFDKYDLVITVTKYTNGQKVEITAPCRIWINRSSNTGYVKKTDESKKNWFWFIWNSKLYKYPSVYEKGQRLDYLGHKEYDVAEKKNVRLLTEQESRNKQIVMAIYNKLKEIHNQTA